MRYELIKTQLKTKGNVLTVTTMCKISKVSKSGYYRYLKNEPKRRLKEEQERKDFKIIEKCFTQNGIQKGSRSIRRILEKKFNIKYSRYKISKLMSKYHLFCSIREKKFVHVKNETTGKVAKVPANLVNREFKRGPREVFLTDITYIKLKSGKFVYLSAITDAFTNEILAHKTSKSFDVQFVLDTVQDLKDKHGKTFKANEEVLLHSDYTEEKTMPKFIII
jgi:hypothetical protein